MSEATNLSMRIDLTLKDEVDIIFKDTAMLEAMAASERIWQSSVWNGTDHMAMEEIDAEIAAARMERKAGRSRT